MPGERPPLLHSERPGALIWWLEADRALCRLVEKQLCACGWRVSLFHRPAAMLSALEHGQPDLLLLDRLISDDQGLRLLHELRVARYHFPVLMLTAMGLPEHRIEGLQAGASDYLAKPFRMGELVWRIEHLLEALPSRPIQPLAQAGPVPVGPLLLEPRGGMLRAPTGMEVSLSRGERALLLALLQASGTVMSREQLALATGSLVDVATSRTLDVRLSRLRRQLRLLAPEGVAIEAVRGQGYRLTVSSAEEGPAESA